MLVTYNEHFVFHCQTPIHHLLSYLITFTFEFGFADNPPLITFPSPFANSSVEIQEDIAIGQEVATLNATDPEGDTLTFTVLGDYSDVFFCDGTSLKTNQSLDYETKRSYYLTIE